MPTWLLSIFSTPLLSFASSIIKSLTNEQVEELQARTGLAATEALAAVNAENVRVAAQRDAQMAAMTHPIWWVAWALFVFPVGLYMAANYMKSVGCMFSADYHACNAAWQILQVPPTLESWGFYVVLSMFGLAATSSVVKTIVSRMGQV